MPLKNYGVLKGRPIARRLGSGRAGPRAAPGPSAPPAPPGGPRRRRHGPHRLTVPHLDRPRHARGRGPAHARTGAGAANCRNSRAATLFGLVMVSLYFFVFYEARLYSDFLRPRDWADWQPA